MRKISISIFLCVACFVSLWGNNKPTDSSENTSLPRSTPQEQNVDEQGIKDFVKAMQDQDQNIHSLMVVRHGKVIHEQWFGDNAADKPHILNSVTKTYTATAVGFAVAENRLKVTDKVISFFPDKLPQQVSPYLEELEIRHLLTMTVGNDPSAMNTNMSQDWIKDFLALPVTVRPGTEFTYSSMASHTLSAIIQKVTGEKLIDYLTPRLFIPLDIQVSRWDEDPMGINTGGYGLYLCTEDMAKLGQFILQKGTWQGKRLLPAAWFDEATAKQVSSVPSWVKWQDRNTLEADHDWSQGYGYQMWRCTHNAVRADGAGGQYILIIPDKDVVIAITSQLQDMGNELDMVWKHIYPALK